jgi:hypothetical protein
MASFPWGSIAAVLLLGALPVFLLVVLSRIVGKLLAWKIPSKLRSSQWRGLADRNHWFSIIILLNDLRFVVRGGLIIIHIDIGLVIAIVRPHLFIILMLGTLLELGNKDIIRTIILLLDLGDMLVKVGIRVRLLKIGSGVRLGFIDNLDIRDGLRRRLKLVIILGDFEAGGLCWVGNYLDLISSDFELRAGESGLAGGFPLWAQGDGIGYYRWHRGLRHSYFGNNLEVPIVPLALLIWNYEGSTNKVEVRPQLLEDLFEVILDTGDAVHQALLDILLHYLLTFRFDRPIDVRLAPF